MDPIRGSGPPSPGNGGEGPSFLNSVAKRVEGLFHSISWLFSDRAEIVRAPEVIIQTWVDSSNQGDREDYKVAQEVILSFLKDKSQNSLYLRGLNIKNLPDIWSIPDIQNRQKIGFWMAKNQMFRIGLLHFIGGFFSRVLHA